MMYKKVILKLIFLFMFYFRTHCKIKLIKIKGQMSSKSHAVSGSSFRDGF